MLHNSGLQQHLQFLGMAALHRHVRWSYAVLLPFWVRHSSGFLFGFGTVGATYFGGSLRCPFQGIPSKESATRPLSRDFQNGTRRARLS